mgnify:CR=1 FL=1
MHTLVLIHFIRHIHPRLTDQNMLSMRESFPWFNSSLLASNNPSDYVLFNLLNSQTKLNKESF